MPLSDKLLHKDLTFHCPHCARAIVKKGEWFRTGPKFKCQRCQHEVQLTYAEKVALFESMPIWSQRLPRPNAPMIA